MSRILSRYLLRETLQTWLVVTATLLTILLTNQLAAVLGDAAANKLPRDAIFELIGLTSLQYLTVLVPVSLFLSVMLALARLYHDSEMAAIMACGIGPAGLYRPLLGFALVLAALVGWVSLAMAPEAAGRVVALADAAKRDVSLSLLKPGQFARLGQTSAVVYAGGVGDDGRLLDVFVQRRVGDRIEVILAEEAWQTAVDAQGQRTLVFARGRRYEGAPGEAGFRIFTFAEHGIPWAPSPRRDGARDPALLSTVALAASAEPAYRAELHWRLAAPLTLLVLAVLAVPLARTEPRKGRFGGIGQAVLIYLVYANLLGAGRGWLERGEVPAVLGLWWVHGVFLGAAVLMLLAQSGFFHGRLPGRHGRAVP